MKVIIDLRDLENTEVRAYLARNLREQKALEVLSDDEADTVKIALLDNPHISKEIVQYLLKNKSECVRAKALTHESIGRADLSIMTADPSNLVKRELAQQAKIARKDLLKLLSEPNEIIVAAAVQNPTIQAKDLLKLSKHPSLSVRYSVLSIAVQRKMYEVVLNMLDDTDDHLREEVEKVIKRIKSRK